MKTISKTITQALYLFMAASVSMSVAIPGPENLTPVTSNQVDAAAPISSQINVSEIIPGKDNSKIDAIKSTQVPNTIGADSSAQGRTAFGLLNLKDKVPDMVSGGYYNPYNPYNPYKPNNPYPSNSGSNSPTSKYIGKYLNRKGNSNGGINSINESSLPQPYRILGENSIITYEYMWSRLNIVVDNQNKITSAYYG